MALLDTTVLPTEIRRIRRLITVMAGSIAALIAVAAPAGYFVINYSNLEASLELHVLEEASAVSKYIYANPALWRYEALRLEEVLDLHHNSQAGRLSLKLMSNDGELVIEEDAKLNGPLLVRTAPVLDGVVEVGRLEIQASLRPLLNNTSLVAALALLIAAGVIVVARVWPFRIIAQAFSHIQESDIALRSAKDAAEAANRSKSEFLSNMSHELRTPLNAVIGFSELIAYEHLGPVGTPAYRDYAQQVVESGRHLLALISDILDLSKIEAGTMVLNEEEIEIAALVRSTAHSMSEVGRANGIEINTDIRHEQGLCLLADNRMLKQILLNLLSNSVKFSPEGGLVTVTGCFSPEDGYHLSVRDHGIGMVSADIPKALERFGQIDAGVNRTFEGTGIGLPLSQSLAQLHGGSLDLESTLGQGTLVTLKLPAERACLEQSVSLGHGLINCDGPDRTLECFGQERA